MKLGLCLNSSLCSLTRYLSIFRNTKIRTVYWDKPVDFDGRLIFAPMEAHMFMMGASWVTIRDRAFAAAVSSINDPLNGRVSPSERLWKLRLAAANTSSE